MFKLTLKGFNPLKDLEISSRSNMFIVTGDEGIGTDYFTSIIRYIGRLLLGVNTEELYWLFNPWQIKQPKTLEFAFELDEFGYHVLLERRTRDYRVKLEEMYKGSEVLFRHEGTKWGKGELLDENAEAIPDNALFWDRIRFKNTDFPVLEAFKTHDLSEFVWYPSWPLNPEHDYFRLDKLFTQEYPDYTPQVNEQLKRLTGGYCELVKVPSPDTGEDIIKVIENSPVSTPYRQSWKLNSLITLIYQLNKGAKVVWHPEQVITHDQVNTFYSLLKEFATYKPVFVVTDDPGFRGNQPVISLENQKKSIVCTQK